MLGSTPRPELIISDLILPAVDGFSLVQRVRGDARLCGVPVVLLTARGMTSDRIAGFDAGASAYISKPFDPEELLAVINALLTNAMLARLSILHAELHSMKEDMSTIKRLIKLLLQFQAQGAGKATGAGLPQLLLELEGDTPVEARRAQPLAQLEGTSALVPSKRRAQAPQSPVPNLTPREREILELVGEGMLNKEIAAQLSVTVSHIEKYVHRLFVKTGTTNRTGLVRRALQLGLLSDDPAELPVLTSSIESGKSIIELLGSVTDA